MDFKPPRGMDDIGPEEMAQRELVYSKIKEVFLRYGFQIVEPTFVEEFKTLSGKSGPEIKDEIYYFKDKSGRELGLRFDLTVGSSRMVANNPNWKKPIRLCSISSMWRYDRPGYGRKRWFYQWNAEIYGVPGPEADAEVILLCGDIMDALGIDCMIKIGNRKVAEALIKKQGVSKKGDVEGCLRTIDKVKKIGKAELLEEFKKYNLEGKKVEELLGDLEKGIDKLDVDGVDELKKVSEILSSVGRKFIIDLTVVRGIGYYTGVVWEGYEKNNPDVGALFGGGRYDSLMEIFDMDLAATGVAGGIERTLMALKSESVASGPDILVIPIKEFEMGVKICDRLRKKGKNAVYDLLGKGLSKNLQYADSKGIKYVIIVGAKDLENKEVTIREMESGKEEKVKLQKIEEYFK